MFFADSLWIPCYVYWRTTSWNGTLFEHAGLQNVQSDKALFFWKNCWTGNDFHMVSHIWIQTNIGWGPWETWHTVLLLSGSHPFGSGEIGSVWQRGKAGDATAFTKSREHVFATTKRRLKDAPWPQQFWTLRVHLRQNTVSGSVAWPPRIFHGAICGRWAGRWKGRRCRHRSALPSTRDQREKAWTHRGVADLENRSENPGSSKTVQWVRWPVGKRLHLTQHLDDALGTTDWNQAPSYKSWHYPLAFPKIKGN